MSNHSEPFLAVYGHAGHRVEVPAKTLAEAEAVARISAGRVEFVAPCHGRQRYHTRATALAAGTGPAVPCLDHWHATDLTDAAKFGSNGGPVPSAAKFVGIRSAA